MEHSVPQAGAARSGLTLGALSLALVRNRTSIAIVTAASTLLALAVALFATPRYSASIILAPPSVAVEGGGLGLLSGQFGGLAELAGFDLSGQQDLDQTLIVLGSREFLERFIEAEGVAPILFEEQWDTATKKWRTDHSKMSQASTALRSFLAKLSGDKGSVVPGRSGPDSWSAYRRFVPLMSVQRDRRTQIVTVEVRWKDPQIAAQWANGLVNRMNAEARARAIRESTRNLNYLARQIEQTQLLEVRDALFRLVEAEQKRVMIANTREEFALRVLSRAQVPRERIFPKRTLLVIGGLVGGFVLGVFLALTRTFVIPQQPRVPM